MRFSNQLKGLLYVSFLLLTVFSAALFAAPASGKNVVIEKGAGLGVIKGVVRDEAGNAIANATVAIFRGGTSKLLKQVSSARDGSFLTKIVPGTYTVLAVAQGFNPVTLFGVEVAKSAELTYGFRLERAGTGNTLPEKRLDRNSSKWRIRAAQSKRSIYQNQEGEKPVAENSPDADKTEDTTEPSTKRIGQTVVETYYAGTSRGNYTGLNFATLVPINNDTAVVFAAQTAKGRNAPLRFETAVRYRPSSKHQLRLATSAGQLGSIAKNAGAKALGQVSLQATDEWQFRDGVILVFGFDYSRFVGAGSDAHIAPRVGLQFDLDAKTRVRAAFTSQTEEKSWANAMDVEGERIAFTEPIAVEDIVIVDDKPQMNKSRRIEFGVERILSGNSSIDASAFIDTTFTRGVSLASVAFDDLGEGFGEIVANQQGSARGARIVYTRRIGGVLSASVGYAFGNGQQLSATAISDQSKIFEGSFFQSFFGQMAADLKTGTSIRTIYRLSPQATVFAIDPFKGRLAIYDPGLSVYVTQHVPTFGLPFRAEAIVDGRNLLDFAHGLTTEEGMLTLNAQRRMLRGGIQVRF